MPETWPELALASWQATLDTVHMYAQVVGKIRLRLAPAEPEWSHVALYVTARGLTTSPMRYEERIFEIDFDFITHKLLIVVSDGQSRSIDLGPRSVASFYMDVMDALRSLGISIYIWTKPQEVANPIPFEQDKSHASYDHAAVERFFRVLAQVNAIMQEYRADFRGRHTPIQFFWGGFDLAYTRFSGKPALPPPGANYIMRLSADAQEICSGFWAGDARFPEPAFFSYAYPKPDGIEAAQIKPSAAYWSKETGLFILRYQDARTSSSPGGTILEFLRSTYAAEAKASGWEVADAVVS